MLMKPYQASNYAEKVIWRLTIAKTKNNIEFPVYEVPAARKKIKISPTTSLLLKWTEYETSDWDIEEKIEPLIVEKYDFDFRVKSTKIIAFFLKKSAFRDSDELPKINNVFSQELNTDRWIIIEIFMRVNKSAVAEMKIFINKSINIICRTLEKPDYQDFNARKKWSNTCQRSSKKVWNLPVRSWKKQSTAWFWRTNFENWFFSKLMTYFSTCNLSGLSWREQKQRSFIRNSSTSPKCLIRSLTGKFKPFIGENEESDWDKQKSKALFGIFGLSGSQYDQKNIKLYWKVCNNSEVFD